MLCGKNGKGSPGPICFLVTRREIFLTSINRLDFSSEYGIKSLSIRVEKCQKCVKFAEKAPSSANP